MERKGAETQQGYCGEFVLLDLLNQREAVYRYVKGWTKEAILDWMKQYGEVRLHDGHTYSFRSAADDLLSGFWFDGDSLKVIR